MKVIQVGIGNRGEAWLRTVLESAQVDYAGFVEIDVEVAGRQVEKYGLEPGLIFSSLAEALAAVPAEGLIDVTPPQYHREVSLMALEAGLPVLSEKPLADTMAAARNIVRKANETGVIHMVAQNYRYSQPVRTLKQALGSGQMGQVGAVKVDFFKGPHFGGFREEMPYPLIIDMAIHHFDMMRFLLDSDPVSIFGRSWNPPWSWYRGDASASILLEFANKVVVSYNGSWCSTGRETAWNGNWRFECEQGVIVLEEDQVYTQPTGQEARPVAPVKMAHGALAYLLAEFYDAVNNGTRPGTHCQDNIKSLAIVFDTVKTFELGQTVTAQGDLPGKKGGLQ